MAAAVLPRASGRRIAHIPSRVTNLRLYAVIMIDMARHPSILRRLTAVFAALSMLACATASNATWQCLDGRPCPPGCRMTQLGPGSALPSCCRTHHGCPLCAGAAMGLRAGSGAQCSSSICVLRFASKPDVRLRGVRPAVPAEIPTAPLVFAAAPLVPESTIARYASVARPPPREAVLAVLSPRAPPALL